MYAVKFKYVGNDPKYKALYGRVGWVTWATDETRRGAILEMKALKYDFPETFGNACEFKMKVTRTLR